MLGGYCKEFLRLDISSVGPLSEQSANALTKG